MPNIEETVHKSWYERYFELEDEVGYLTASYNPELRLFWICDIEVKATERRKGYGKQLLSLALEEARAKEAELVIASIISRECLDAAVAVFGESSVKISELGTYGTPREVSTLEVPQTSAFLRYEIWQPTSSIKLANRLL